MAFAYLDAGTGSMLLSAAVGGVAAAGVAVRQVQHRLRGKFRRGGGTDESTESTTQATAVDGASAESAVDEAPVAADPAEDETTAVASDT